MAMREHGIGDVKEIEAAVLETDGSISIVPKADQAMKTAAPTVRFLKRDELIEASEFEAVMVTAAS